MLSSFTSEISDSIFLAPCHEQGRINEVASQFMLIYYKTWLTEEFNLSICSN